MAQGIGGVVFAANTLPRELAEILIKHQIRTVEDFLYHDVSYLAQITSTSTEYIQSICNELEGIYAAKPFRADVFHENSLSNGHIFSTGAESFDDLLGGGVFTGQILELVGDPISGKTQICFSTLANALSQGASVAFVDTSNTFSADRIAEMLCSPRLNPFYQKNVKVSKAAARVAIQEMLKSVKQFNAFDVFQMIEVLEHLQTQLQAHKSHILHTALHPVDISTNEQPPECAFYGKLSLIILDSLGSLLGPVLQSGGPNYGHYLLIRISRLIKAIARNYNVAFITVNYAVSTAPFGRDEPQQVNAPKKPGLGEAWSYVPNTQVMCSFDKLMSNKRTITLLKSALQETPQQVLIQITETGIQDCKQNQQPNDANT